MERTAPTAKIASPIQPRNRRAPQASPVPTPAKYDSRICFGIAYFKTEADADRYAAHVTAQGRTYNGGYFHGRPCGRDRTWDHTDANGVQYFAVTD